MASILGESQRLLQELHLRAGFPRPLTLLELPMILGTGPLIIIIVIRDLDRIVQILHARMLRRAEKRRVLVLRMRIFLRRIPPILESAADGPTADPTPWT